ncbi:hypothetical protein, partial [Azospirillum brasilense]|uniref:hypothetical protein n=1 Tax=Azospirillum brasilense TaxID=192 RepID=UPI0012DFCE9B
MAAPTTAANSTLSSWMVTGPATAVVFSTTAVGAVLAVPVPPSVLPVTLVCTAWPAATPGALKSMARTRSWAWADSTERKPEPPPVRLPREAVPVSVRASMAAIRPVSPVWASAAVCRSALPEVVTATPVETLTVRVVTVDTAPVCRSTTCSRTTGTSARSALAVLLSSTRSSLLAAMVTVVTRLPSSPVVIEPLTVAPSTVAAAGGATGAGLSTVAVSFCVVAMKGTEALPAGSVRPSDNVRVPSPKLNRSRPVTRVVPPVVTPLPVTRPPPDEVMVQVKVAPASLPLMVKALLDCSTASMLSSSNRTVAVGAVVSMTSDCVLGAETLPETSVAVAETGLAPLALRLSVPFTGVAVARSMLQFPP